MDYELVLETLAIRALSAVAVIGLISFLSNPGTAPLASGYLAVLGVFA